MRIKTAFVILASVGLAVEATAEGTDSDFDEAVHCAALGTFLSALLAQSSSSNPVTENKLRRSSVRWLKHAATLPPRDEIAVMDAYLAKSQAIANPAPEGSEEPAATRARLGADLRKCAEAEIRIFGSSYREL